MTTPELEQLTLFAQIDELMRRLSEFSAPDSTWDPLNQCRALIRRLLKRLEVVRIRLESPLIVAMFGGTGTGKSSLVNALVGLECTKTSRERPTTTQPVLIAHPLTELEPLRLPLDDFAIVRFEAPILRDIVIIDCPDPDTSETTNRGTNLERLHRLLPHCDVLIYTSTQQKYRSARVGVELGQAATGCRLLFVQTHADIDDDIRDDWRGFLEEHYEVPEVFFVDSLRAFSEQREGRRPSGDFGRLQDLLATGLAASERVQIRRANLLDLIHTALKHCSEELATNWPAIKRLQIVLDEQRLKLISTLSAQLRDELQQSQHLWERRLLGSVTQNWGLSPFSSVLRFYNGFGSFIASASLFRARSSAQVALIGALQGTRWLSTRRKERDAESQLDRISSFGLDDGLLRESQLVISGYLRDAHIDPELADDQTLDKLRHDAARLEDEFLGGASRQIDNIIADLAGRKAGMFTRIRYEFMFLTFVGFVLYRIGKNFFYDSNSFFVKPPEAILTPHFYVPAGVFFLLWSGLLVMMFTRKLRRGLKRKIDELADELAQSRLSPGLFPHLEQACQELERQRNKFDAISSTTIELRSQLAATPGLGSPVDQMHFAVSPISNRP